MFGSRFFWKTYAGMVAVILVTALVVGVTVGRRIERDALQDQHARLEESAVLARELLAHDGDFRAEELPQTLARLRAESAVRYTLIAADGAVLADTDRDPTGMESHADRPELIDAQATGSGMAVRYSESLRTRMLYVALRVPGAGPVALVRTAVPLRQLEERQFDFRRTVALGVGVASLVGLLFGLVMARNVTKPLVEMSEVARAIAAGDLDRRLAVTSRDEVGALGRSVNLMTGQLQERLEALTEDRNKLQAVLSGMIEGVVAVDPEERVLHLNRAAAQVLGADAEAAVGQPFRSVTRVQEIADALSDAIRSGVDRRREILLPSYPQERILEVHSAPILGPGSESMGAVLVLHDITELRRLEAVRRDFVASVSHELKTPLTAVRGILETVLDDPGMPEKTRQRFLGKVDGHSRRLVQIVTDLLNLTRAESRPEDLPRESLDLRIPVRETCRALESAAAGRRLDLQVELPEEAVLIRGDRPSLRLVADNLVDNAVKYTPEGGRVSIRLAVEEGWAILEVEDTGIGIPEQHRGRLFERFYRVDAARSRELGGTGLGLAIVKHVAQAHDGDVSFESATGEGTVFRFRLPLESSRGPAPDRPPVPPAG